jgi:hypothetical protein
MRVYGRCAGMESLEVNFVASLGYSSSNTAITCSGVVFVYADIERSSRLWIVKLC